MTQEEANKIITEKMNKCWHEANPNNSDECIKCGVAFQNANTFEPMEVYNYDYFTPEGFFKCWNWAKGKIGWLQFLDKLHYDKFDVYSAMDQIDVAIIDPEVFPLKLAEFIRDQAQ
jgi:hypothetical protein